MDFDKARTGARDSVGFQMSDDGVTAWADLHKRMASYLVTSLSDASVSLQWEESSIDRVLNLRDSADLVPVWCVQIDSCRVHKGMSQTALAFTVVNGTSQPNSLSATREFLVFEAGDKWQYLRKHADVGLQSTTCWRVKPCDWSTNFSQQAQHAKSRGSVVVIKP